MKTKTVPVYELFGKALNWAVAKCNNEEYVYRKSYGEYGGFDFERRNYTTSWASAGDIIFKHRIAIQPFGKNKWAATEPDSAYPICHIDECPRRAAMRVFVQMTLGKEVEVPLEYLENE